MQKGSAVTYFVVALSTELAKPKVLVPQANVSSIADLALISQEQIYHLQHHYLGDFPDICKYHYYAAAVYEKCNVKPQWLDTDSLDQLDKLALFEGEVIQDGQERIQGVEVGIS